MKRLIMLSIIAVLFTACTSQYSDGARTGYITKFSNKGWIYSTWEGEMNVGVSQFSESEKDVFVFSLDAESQRGEDIEALADSLNLALELGYRVSIHYNQEKHMDWNNSRGSTSYYVDKVVIIR